jgi:hypothetical protein
MLLLIFQFIFYNLQNSLFSNSHSSRHREGRGLFFFERQLPGAADKHVGQTNTKTRGIYIGICVIGVSVKLSVEFTQE